MPSGRRLLPLLAVVAVLAGCGGSTPKGPPALLFVSTKDGDYAIFGTDAQGKHVRRLTKQRGDPSTPEGLFFQTEPAWSPDGRRIVFTSRRDGGSHIYVMRANGTHTRRLTSSARADDHPSWSPDGKWILFGREGALFRIPSSGGAAQRVGHGPGNADHPAWSPDGRLIAYDYRNPGTPIREIYVMRADGSENRRLTNIQGVSGSPAWSPDGKRIAFHGKAGTAGNFEIYTVGAGGKGLRQVTGSNSDAFEPAWSPDGRLAYSRDGAIWVDDNGTDTQLTPGENNDSSPAWRPPLPK